MKNDTTLLEYFDFDFNAAQPDPDWTLLSWRNAAQRRAECLKIAFLVQVVGPNVDRNNFVENKARLDVLNDRTNIVQYCVNAAYCDFAIQKQVCYDAPIHYCGFKLVND